MKVKKPVKEAAIAALGGSGFILIMLGIQAVASKGNWIIFMACGLLLCIGAILIAKKVKV